MRNRSFVKSDVLGLKDCFVHVLKSLDAERVTWQIRSGCLHCVFYSILMSIVLNACHLLYAPSNELPS